MVRPMEQVPVQPKVAQPQPDLPRAAPAPAPVSMPTQQQESPIK